MKQWYLIPALCASLLSHAQDADFRNLDSRHYIGGNTPLRGGYFVAGVQDHDGFLWIGGQYGLLRYDGYRFQSYEDVFRNGRSLSSDHVRYIDLDRNGYLWISTIFGLNKVDPATGEIQVFHHYPDNPKSLGSERTECVLHDQDGRIWIATHRGLDLLLDTIGNFTHYHLSTEEDNAKNVILSLCADPFNPDHLWIGTQDGLFLFLKSQERFVEYPVPQHVIPLSSDGTQEVNYIFQHTAEDLWCYSYNRHDLIRMDIPSGKFQVYPLESKKKLSPHRDQAGYYIMERTKESLWISTTGGIGSFHKISGQYTLIELGQGEDSGILESPVRRFFADRHGRLWLPSLQGVSFINDSIARPSPLLHTAKPFIHRVVLDFGEIIPVRPADTLRVDAVNRMIAIKAGYPNPRNPSNLNFQYRFHNRDTSWINNGPDPEINITDLKGGLSRFEIRVEVKDEGHTTEPVSFFVLQERFFWQVPSVKFAGGAIIIIGLAGLYTWRIRQIRMQESLKRDFAEELAKVQLHALRAQMNPHFLFNTLNSINHYILRNDRDQASAYLAKFSRLIRDILNNSMSEMVSLADDLKVLKLYIELEQLRFENQFTYNLCVEDGINLNKIEVPPLLIQPYVENAIWHGLVNKGTDGKLIITIRQSGNALSISIRDNGIGREAARQYSAAQAKRKSMGIQLTKDRIGLINKLYHVNAELVILDLKDTSGKAAGTEVIIQIPRLATISGAQV